MTCLHWCCTVVSRTVRGTDPGTDPGARASGGLRTPAGLAQSRVLTFLFQTRSRGGMQDGEEREECMAALSKVARSLDTSDLPRLRACAAAFARAACRLTRTAPLEALAAALLAAGRAAARADAATHFSFVHTRLAVLLEDANPAAALRVLLAAAADASAAAEAASLDSLLDAALAVYHRYCAAPPLAIGGLMQVRRPRPRGSFYNERI